MSDIIGATFDWGELGRCTVEVALGTLIKFRAPNGVLYQVSRDYWQRMADNKVFPVSGSAA